MIYMLIPFLVLSSCEIKDENFILGDSGYVVFPIDEFNVIEGDSKPYILPVFFNGVSNDPFLVTASIRFGKDEYREYITVPNDPSGDVIRTKIEAGSNSSAFVGMDIINDTEITEDRQITISLTKAGTFKIGAPVTGSLNQIKINILEDDFNNVLGYTSFEDTNPKDTDRFYKDFNATSESKPHDIVNKEGFNIVDFSPTGKSTELAFDSSYKPILYADGEKSNNFKEISVIGAVKSAIHEVDAQLGEVTYAFNNTHGNILVDFGTFDFTSTGRTNFSFWTFFKNGSYLELDGITVLFESEGQTNELLTLKGSGTDNIPRNMLFNDLRGRWIKSSARLPNQKGKILFVLSSSKAEQFVFIDNVKILSEKI